MITPLVQFSDFDAPCGHVVATANAKQGMGRHSCEK